VIDNSRVSAAFGFNHFVREFGSDVKLNFAARGDVDVEEFLGDDAGAVEGVVEPKVGGQRVMRYRGDDAVFEIVPGREPQDADGLDAHVLVGGGVDDGGIGLIGDGAGQEVGGAAAGMGDANERNLDGFERAVVVEVEADELANAEFAVDVHAGVDFLTAIAVGFEAVARFEQLNLCGIRFFLGRGRLFGLFLGGLFCGLLDGLLGEASAHGKCDEEKWRQDSEEEKRTP